MPIRILGKWVRPFGIVNPKRKNDYIFYNMCYGDLVAFVDFYWITFKERG